MAMSEENEDNIPEMQPSFERLKRVAANGTEDCSSRQARTYYSESAPTLKLIDS